MSHKDEIEAKKLSPTKDFLPSDGSPCSAHLVPKSAYNVGDPVMVRCDDHPDVPFPATISSVWWCLKYNQHEYRVMEYDGCESDGYTDEWMSPQNV